MLNDSDDYKKALAAAKEALSIVAAHDIAHVVSSIDQWEMLGPVIMPDKWKERADEIMTDREVLAAALPLWELAAKLDILRAAPPNPCGQRQAQHAPPCILPELHKGAHEDRNGRKWR